MHVVQLYLTEFVFAELRERELGRLRGEANGPVRGEEFLDPAGRMGGDTDQLDINPIEYRRDVLLRIAAPGTAADPAELTPKRWKEDAEAKARVHSSRAAIAAVVSNFGCC